MERGFCDESNSRDQVMSSYTRLWVGPNIGAAPFWPLQLSGYPSFGDFCICVVSHRSVTGPSGALWLLRIIGMLFYLVYLWLDLLPKFAKGHYFSWIGIFLLIKRCYILYFNKWYGNLFDTKMRLNYFIFSLFCANFTHYILLCIFFLILSFIAPFW